MNLLYTTVGNFQTLESQACVTEWRARYHIVEQMPMERVATYLRFDIASSLALVDAIVCMADTDRIAFREDSNFHTFDFPLQKALALAADVRSLPESCAMRDGRKWRLIPFVIFFGAFDSGTMLLKQEEQHVHIYPLTLPLVALRQIQEIVDEYQVRVLEDYRNLGFLVRFEKGWAQIGPALKLKDNRAENEYYYSPGDRRNNSGWVTVKRDSEGLRQDVELFQMLLDKGATETEMHRFFEEHPAILMEARLGIPISHGPNFVRPRDNKPDFAFSPILGPQDDRMIELMELKGPTAKTLTLGPHRGFTANVHHAIDQVRDYDRYLRDPANFEAILRAFGYIPDDSNRAVLIGRAPRDKTDSDAWMQRQTELDVKIITYDEILETQANQIRGPYSLCYGTEMYPIDE